MRKRLLLLVGALLCPLLAAAQSRIHQGDFRAPEDYPDASGWLSVGIGAGSVESAAPAPAADRNGFTGSIDMGYGITPQWGLGLELGMIAPTSGCDARRCSPGQPDFAPDFSHWFALGEYRPGGAGLRLRVGAGLSRMCYQFYEGSYSVGDALLDGLFGTDTDGSPHIHCHSLKAFGAAASIGYQWSLGRGVPVSLGLQLRGEAANFAASTAAGTRPFQHRAVMMQLQLNID